MNFKVHWEQVYATKKPEQMGWYEPHLTSSLALITQTGLSKAARIIDVGGGASTLTDDLLNDGFTHITVVDLSSAALTLAKSRLKERAKQVKWLAGDITQLSLPKSYYDVWHDRAVFHFLTTREDRRKYIDALHHALKPAAYIVMATFSPEAPPTCSGLTVVRYSPAQLHDELGKDWILEGHRRELHMTPSGVAQQYIYCRFRRPA